MDDKILSADILDYEGKVDKAVVVLLSIKYGEKFGEGIFIYDDKVFTISVDSDIKEYIGQDIEQWDGYMDFIESIFKKLVPYNEIFTRIDDLKFVDKDNDDSKKEE